MPFIEIIGAVTGVASVWLLTRQNALGWPLGLVYIVISMFLFFKARLYGEFVAHIVFFILSVYGWLNWSRRGSGAATSLLPQFLSSRERIVYLIIAATLAGGTGFIFQKFTNNALPYLDSLVMSLSFVAMWLSAHKKIENWVLWILVNLISVGIYLSLGLYVYALLYCLFLAQAFNGFFTWKPSNARN